MCIEKTGPYLWRLRYHPPSSRWSAPALLLLINTPINPYIFWKLNSIPANFFWDISVRFLCWECWDFWRRHDHFRRFPKKSEVFRRRPKSAEVCQRRARFQYLSLQKSEIARKVLPFISFTHGFRSLHGSELTYFWKLCQAGRQQLTFFNQAWEIGPQAWASVRSKFSTCRRESWQV